MKRESAVDSHRRHSRRIGRLLVGLAIAILLTAAGDGLAAAATGRQAQPVPPGEEILEAGDHIHICHALGNGGFNDPYPSVSNVVAEHGHTSHPLDIIPPFFHRTHQGVVMHYPGKNWNAETGNANGQAIWENGCSRPAPPDSQIQVFVTCVDVHGSTYDATFGYKSNTDVSIPVGSSNQVQPDGPDRGQVTSFQSAEVLAAFTVTGVASNVDLTWTVTHAGATSTATARAAINLPCTEQPPPDPDLPIGVFVTCVVEHGATYDAVFGYENQNADAETIHVGDTNFFSPGDRNRAQPETFLPGVHNEAVVVRGIPSSVHLAWTVVWTDVRSAIATPAFEPKCVEAQGPPPTPTPPPTPPPPPSSKALPIGVFAVCVTNHGSHYDATFGYVNDNSEVVSVPIGSHNAVTPGPAGQGQPAAFHPGFVDRAFTVTGVSNSHAVTWTVRVGDQVRVATATASIAQKCLTAPIDPAADAAVTKIARPGTVTVGERVRFTILVRNTGSAVLAPAQVTDTLPAALLRIVSATSTLGRCHLTTAGGSRHVHCRAPALAPGQSLRIHVTAQATAAGSASDRATVVGLPRSVASATVHILGPPPPAVTG